MRNKFVKRIMLVGLTAAMVLAMTVGCGGKKDGTTAGTTGKNADFTWWICGIGSGEFYEKFEDNSFYLPKHKKIIVYCERGATSFLVARMLHDKGYQMYTVIGGYNAISKEFH